VNETLQSRFQDHDFQNTSYRVYTTLDMNLQRDAVAAVRAGILETDQQWKRRSKAYGTDEMPLAQVALVCLDAETGELKALVTSNVYDTATGQYLLIPQGARLVGKYDSRVSYGQNGVQVAWSRIIFPDASSIDLDGMLGLDSHGNAGLRDQVDRHYKRLIGMSVLSSMFMAAFAISQNRSQTVLTYPTPAQAAETAVGQDLSMTGAQMARSNMNVQPTIKVPAGYRFTVRVNRDILFEAPYEPARPQMPESQSRRSAFSVSR